MIVTIHQMPATRVLLGEGAVGRVSQEVDRLAACRVLLISSKSSKSVSDVVALDLGDRLVGRFHDPVAHTPTSVTDEVLARTGDIDAVVAIGGGSAIGLSKAVAVRRGIAQIVIPTTYAGSEVTPVLGEVADGRKTVRRDPQVVPGTVIYDPDLTVSMPTGLSVASALNALAHVVETLWAGNRTAFTEALATEAIGRIVGSVGRIIEQPDDTYARAQLQQGAWLAGTCLAHVQMGLQHQLAHDLGGRFDLPHAPLHALLLAPVMRFNLTSAPEATDRLVRLLGSDPAEVVHELNRAAGNPTRLRDLDVPRDELANVAAEIAASPYPNPRPPLAAHVELLLSGIW